MRSGRKRLPLRKELLQPLPPRTGTVTIKAAPQGAPTADVSGDEEPLIKEGAKGKKGKKGKTAKSRIKKAKAAPAKVAAPKEEAPAEAAAPAAEAAAPAEKPAEKGKRPTTSGYTLDFGRSTHQLTPDAERQLAQIAETMVYYPMETLKVVGYAQPGEQDSAGLADRRAKMVAGLLINKYQIDPKKIQTSSEVSDLPGAKVSATFVKSE